MANPTPASVNDKTPAWQPTSASTTTSTTTTTAPQDASKGKTEAPAEDVTYHALKAFTLDDGRTVMPGEEFNPGDVTKWPERRTKQLVDQKYLKESKAHAKKK